MIKETKLDKKEKKVKNAKKKLEQISDKKENKVMAFINKNAVLQYSLMGLAVFILCSIFTAQVNTISNTESVIQGKRESDLIDDLTALKMEYEELKTENEKNLEIVEEYKNDASDNNSLINSLNNEINTMGALSGLKTLKGQGIVMTVDDSDMAVSGNMSTESMLVHDTDLQAIVTELNAAGAEAISVNGQRILSTTAIRCVGPVIQINGVKVAAPFSIKAIGNAKYLESALNIRGGIVDNFKLYGIKANISIEENIQINKHDGTLSIKNAKVVE